MISTLCLFSWDCISWTAKTSYRLLSLSSKVKFASWYLKLNPNLSNTEDLGLNLDYGAYVWSSVQPWNIDGMLISKKGTLCSIGKDVWRSGAVLPKYSKSRIKETHVVPKRKTQAERGKQNLNRSPLFTHLSWAVKAFMLTAYGYWPALGYVAMSISSGLAWKFWMFSQLLVK